MSGNSKLLNIIKKDIINLIFFFLSQDKQLFPFTSFIKNHAY